MSSQIFDDIDRMMAFIAEEKKLLAKDKRRSNTTLGQMQRELKLLNEESHTKLTPLAFRRGMAKRAMKIVEALKPGPLG